MSLRIVLTLLSLLVVLLSGCVGQSRSGIVDYGKQSGKVTAYRTPDDVSMFSYPPNNEAIVKIAKDWPSLEQRLNALVVSGRVNEAAFLAAYAPAQYDADVAGWVEGRVQDLPPTFMMALSRKYDATDTKLGFKWFMRGFVLTRVDSKLCLDKSARQGLAYLGSLMGENLKGRFDEYKESGLLHDESMAALDFASEYVPTYTPMWICSHGISSFTAGGNKGFESPDKRAEKLETLKASYPGK